MARATAGRLTDRTIISTVARGSRWRAAWRVTLLALLAAGCATTPRVWMENDTVAIAWQAKSSAGSELRDLRLTHPIDLTAEAVANQLRSLRCQPIQGDAPVQPVFVEDEVMQLAAPLSDALRHVSHLDLVHFRLRTAAGPTSGEVFATRDHLHWRLEEIAGLPFAARAGGGEPSPWDWRLVPGTGQTLFAPPTPLGSRTVANWVVADFALPSATMVPGVRMAPAAAAVSPPGPAGPLPATSAAAATDKPRTPSPLPASLAPTHKAPSQAEPARANLEEKLETLKRLYDKGLIDPDEYQTRKQQLLDEYF
jgi:hypothetical protein